MEPETLRQMIELEIERLSTEEQRVLEIAGVTGVSFTAEATGADTAIGPEEFERVCENLSRRHHMFHRAGAHRSSHGPFASASSSHMRCIATSLILGKRRVAGQLRVPRDPCDWSGISASTAP